MGSSPRAKKSHFVRCMGCKKILRASQNDTDALMDHIRTAHPELLTKPNSDILLKQSPSRQSGGSQKEPPSATPRGYKAPPLAEPASPSSDNTSKLTTASEIIVSASNGESESRESFGVYEVPELKGSPRRRQFRTSIEKWRPGTGMIYCPKCYVNKRPLIKTRTERISENSCGAACLLGCWPFCFLPFLCSGEEKQYLHCANCKTFLGLYDPVNNCVRPNREFLQPSNLEKNPSVQKVAVD